MDGRLSSCTTSIYKDAGYQTPVNILLRTELKYKGSQTMRKQHVSWLLVFVLLSVRSGLGRESGQSTNGEQYVGTYSGTWDGAGTGNFELTLEKVKDGGVTGKVAVTTDGGNYTADLKALSFDDKKMNAKYDFPLDLTASSEVVLVATIDGTTIKGTWSLRPKGQEGEVAKGTWTVTKK